MSLFYLNSYSPHREALGIQTHEQPFINSNFLKKKKKGNKTDKRTNSTSSYLRGETATHKGGESAANKRLTTMIGSCETERKEYIYSDLHGWCPFC